MARLIGCDPIFMNIHNDAQRFYITLLLENIWFLTKYIISIHKSKGI
jgi:hypothetical protein